MNIIDLWSTPMKTNVLLGLNAGLKASIGLTIKRFFQVKDTAFESKFERKRSKSECLNFATNITNHIEVDQRSQETTKDFSVLNGGVKKVITVCAPQPVLVNTDLTADIALQEDKPLNQHQNSTHQPLLPVSTSETIFILDISKSLSSIDEANLSYKSSPVLTNFQSTQPELKTSKLKSSTRLKVVHRFDGSIELVSAGHLVISGCIDDVCAELERMAQYE